MFGFDGSLWGHLFRKNAPTEFVSEKEGIQFFKGNPHDLIQKTKEH